MAKKEGFADWLGWGNSPRPQDAPKGTGAVSKASDAILARKKQECEILGADMGAYWDEERQECVQGGQTEAPPAAQ